MSTHEPTSGNAPRSTSGQLASPNGAGNRLTGQHPTQYPTATTRQLPGPMSALLSGQPLLGTQPLPALLAASGNAGPAPTLSGIKPGTAAPAPAHGPTASQPVWGSTGSGGYSGYGAGAGGSDYDFGASAPTPVSLATTGSTAAYGSPSLASQSAAHGNGSPNTAPSLQALAASTTAAAQGNAAATPASYGSAYGASAGYGASPSYGASASAHAPTAAAMPTAAPTATTPANGSATGAAYGSPGYASAYAPSGGAGPLPRTTQMYGHTLTGAGGSLGAASTGTGAIAGAPTGWSSPSLPVSPWGAPTAATISSGRGAFSSEAVLQQELKKAKWGRFRARFYLLVVLVGVGVGAYYALGHYKGLVAERDAAANEGNTLRTSNAQLLQKLNAAPAAASGGAAAAFGKPVAVGPTSPATAKLADELKRALAGAPAVVETRGNRVVVAMDAALLFPGKETEVSVGGYRTLYRFGKALKLVKDRRVAITVPSVEIKRVKAWNLAAARAVSLGNFFLADLGFEPGRVSATTPAPRPTRMATLKTSPGRVEFALDTL